jgi:predicted aldo/keto reductase-like oxidoreductase
MKNFKPLDEDEQKIIQQAQRILGQSSTVPCTACRYCTEGCSMQIPIPDIFSSLNLQLGNGQLDEAKKAYLQAAQEGHRASDCIECGQCENACPQHISIIECLKNAAQTLEV